MKRFLKENRFPTFYMWNFRCSATCAMCGNSSQLEIGALLVQQLERKITLLHQGKGGEIATQTGRDYRSRQN